MTYKPNDKMQALLDAMRDMPQKTSWDSCDAAATLRVEQSQVAAYIKSAVDHGVLHKAVVNGRMLLSLQPFTADRLATAPSSAPPAFVPPRMGEARPVPPPPLGDPATKPRPAAEPPRPYAAVVTAPPRQQPLPPEPTPAPTKAPRGLGAWPRSGRSGEAAGTPAPAPTVAQTPAPTPAAAPATIDAELASTGVAAAPPAAPAATGFDAAMRLDGSIRIYGADVLDDGSFRISPQQWSLLRTRFAWSHA